MKNVFERNFKYQQFHLQIIPAYLAVSGSDDSPGRGNSNVGVSKYIKRAFAAKPFTAIVLATHMVMTKGWLGQPILRSRKSIPVQGTFELIKNVWIQLKSRVSKSRSAKHPVGPVGSSSETLLQLAPVLQATSLAPVAVGAAGCESCSSEGTSLPVWQLSPAVDFSNAPSQGCCKSQPVESTCCDHSTSCYSLVAN